MSLPSPDAVEPDDEAAEVESQSEPQLSLPSPADLQTALNEAAAAAAVGEDANWGDWENDTDQ